MIKHLVMCVAVVGISFVQPASAEEVGVGVGLDRRALASPSAVPTVTAIANAR